MSYAVDRQRTGALHCQDMTDVHDEESRQSRQSRQPHQFWQSRQLYQPRQPRQRPDQCRKPWYELNEGKGDEYLLCHSRCPRSNPAQSLQHHSRYPFRRKSPQRRTCPSQRPNESSSTPRKNRDAWTSRSMVIIYTALQLFLPPTLSSTPLLLFSTCSAALALAVPTDAAEASPHNFTSMEVAPESSVTNSFTAPSKRYIAPSRPADAPPIDYGGRHPFDQYRHLYSDSSDHISDHTSNHPPTRSSHRRSAAKYTSTTFDPETDHLYQPLRIQFEMRTLRSQLEISLGAGDITAATQLYLLIYDVLPTTAHVWGDILRVIPIQGGIYPLQAQGADVDVLIPSRQEDQDQLYGEKDDPVRLLYCPDETTAGISGGADLLIYATVNRHCASGQFASDGGGSQPLGTLASALSCQRDQYDRPITGSIDFCLGGMGNTLPIDVEEAMANREEGVLDGGVEGTWVSSSVVWEDGGEIKDKEDPNRAVVQYSVGVAVHEIAHVLGVTSDSLAFFRHPITGHPLTPRPFTLSTVTCVSGEEIAYVGKPSNKVMKEGVSEGTDQRYFEVITPTVRRVVQNQFNCDMLEGARLENQPTSSDCFGSHFDERLYFTEIMGAVFSESTNVLSPLTLALLEDSGWYRANYQSEYVQISTFGHGAGCDFVNQNCIDSQGQVPKPMQEQFCNNVIYIGANGKIIPLESDPQTCDPSHTRKTYCDWIDVNEAFGRNSNLEEAPENFQYFEDNPTMRPYLFTTADYCPIPHLDPQSCTRFNGRPVSNEQWDAGEYYGHDSRCYETDSTRSYSMCLQTVCNEKSGKVQVMAGGRLRTCEYDGQIHTIFQNYGGDGPLRIKCPKAALMCPHLFCPSNCSGRGTCVYRTRSDPDSVPVAQCICDSEKDTTEGCYDTALSFPEGYGDEFQTPNHADKTLFMIITGSLVAGLAVMYCVVRQWKARRNVFM